MHGPCQLEWHEHTFAVRERDVKPAAMPTPNAHCSVVRCCLDFVCLYSTGIGEALRQRVMCVPLSGRAYEADGGEWGVAWGDVRAAIGASLRGRRRGVGRGLG